MFCASFGNENVFFNPKMPNSPRQAKERIHGDGAILTKAGFGWVRESRHLRKAFTWRFVLDGLKLRNFSGIVQDLATVDAQVVFCDTTCLSLHKSELCLS